MDEMKKLLFSLSRAEMKETFTEYSSKAPTSLTSQFPDRVGKADAVKAYEERTQKITQLFPTGKLVLTYYSVGNNPTGKGIYKLSVDFFRFIMWFKQSKSQPRSQGSFEEGRERTLGTR